MQKIMLLSLSVAVLTACTIFEPVPAEAPYESFSLVAGDTVKTRVEKNFKEFKKNDASAKNFLIVGDTVVTYKEPKLHTPPAKKADLSKLKNNDDPDLKGKPLRMVAIGGSLTAGVRDGGYFNEGIMTSYPNLIARQMGISFEQPLFDAADYNGYGRKTRTSFNPTGGPVPKFKEVSNNSGVDNIEKLSSSFGSIDKVNLKPNKQANIDNFSFPDLENGSLYVSSNVNSIADFNNGNTLNFGERNFKASFIKRLNIDKGKSIIKNVFDKKSDIFILEYGWNNQLSNLLNKPSTFSPYWGGLDFFNYPLDYISKQSGVDPLVSISKYLQQNKQKAGVYLNVPNFLNLPAFNYIKYEEVKKIMQMGQTYQLYGVSLMGTDLMNAKWLPSSSVDSLISPKVHISLKKGIRESNPLPNGLVTREGQLFLNNIKGQNESITTMANAINFPVADIYTLYENLNRGSLFTEEGVKVTMANFFSTDGINPSAYGQAIIANEVIRTLNKHYKSEIPLIKVAEYLVK